MNKNTDMEWANMEWAKVQNQQQHKKMKTMGDEEVVE